MEIIGHRGSSYAAPENTLASVELAWREAADAVEIDVWLTRDQRIVVFHDGALERIAHRPGKISEMQLEELQSIDVGVWKGAKWAGQHMPTLEAVLATIPDEKRLFVEIKAGPEIVGEFLRVVQASGKKPSQVVVIAFKLAVVQAIKAKMPSTAVYWLCGQPRQDKRTGKWLDQPADMLETCRKKGFDGLDVDRRSPLTREYVDQVHRAGLKLYVWTVNSAEEARRMAELGVDGITTDRPGWLREQLQTCGGDP